MPPRRRADPRRLSDKERAEWLSFTQALGARPLRPTDTATVVEPVAPVAASVTDPVSRPPAPQARVKPKLTELTVGGAAPGLDSASWDKLRRGRMRPQRVLDLHGRTVHAAFGAFEQFIGAARADGIRCVEIVTGRGAGEGGVLRRELPLWLNLPQLRGAILAASHPHRANVGAVVLLLRRVR